MSNTYGININDNRKRRIIEALLSCKLDSALDDKIRLWLFEQNGCQEEKYNILVEVAHGYYKRPVTADSITIEDLKAINKRLGLPEKEYRLQDGVYKIPHYKPTIRFRENNQLFKKKLALKVAAVLIPIIIAVAAVNILLNNRPQELSQLLAQEITVSAQSDDMRLELPDNSTVVLAAGSELRHMENMDGKRSVELRGEAYFHVTKTQDTNNNFNVHTEHLKISVLGTGFRVCSPAGNDYSTIDLYNGNVMVEAGGSNYTLLPGEHLLYRHSTQDVEITTISIKDRIYDNMPGLDFEDVAMTQIFDEISRLYGVDIQVNGTVPPSWGNIRTNLTGERSMDGVMSILSMISDKFKYEITDNEIIVTPSN